MTIHLNPNQGGLSTLTLVLFLLIGVAMMILGVTDFDGANLMLLIGAVVTGSNAVAIFRRRARRIR